MLQTFYLIRHTTPAVKKGVCYGQSDLDVTDSFRKEAAVIRQCLHDAKAEHLIGKIYTSPLQRCRKLAAHLFPGRIVAEAGELKEIHCGQWEMREWNDIPGAEIDPWMKDFVNVRIPGGESYLDLYGRVIPWFNRILGETPKEKTKNIERPVTAVFTHGGVIRSILSFVTGTSLVDSFKTFSLHYGCVIRLTLPRNTIGGDATGRGFPIIHPEFLSNIPPAEKERHKPGTDSTFT